MEGKQYISELVKAMKNGDQLAFNAIHNMYYDKLTAFVRMYTKDIQDAEDIVQDTFIKIWNAKDKLDTIDSFNSYLYRMAYNAFLDGRRKDVKEQNMLDSWKYKRMLDTIEEDDELKKRRIQKLKAAIELLPPRCKEVFLLCKFENRSHDEIATALSISKKTVQAQMCKAYTLIRNALNLDDTLNLFLLFPELFEVDKS